MDFYTGPNQIILILGAELGLAWLSEQKKMSALLVMESGDLRVSDNFEEINIKELLR